MPICDLISTASVPVIKMKFNPMMSPKADSVKLMNMIVDVDISIDDSSHPSHKGIACSEYVSSTVNHYTILKPVCLVLKRMLVRNDLNSPYTGGLGSYSLILML